MNELRLASLLCTRLCHDLVGPIGAVNNGLELLGEPAEGMADDVVRLVQQSAGESSRRLQFFRAAYGLPTPARAPVDLATARGLAEGLFDGAKIALDWPAALPALPPEHGGQITRLLLNMLLCAAETLPRGGRLAVRVAAADDGLAMEVSATGPATNVAEGFERGLAGTEHVETLEPRTVQPHFTGRLAAALDAGLELARPSAETLSITARLALPR